jgi:hypothetical protein
MCVPPGEKGARIVPKCRYSPGWDGLPVCHTLDDAEDLIHAAATHGQAGTLHLVCLHSVCVQDLKPGHPNQEALLQ